MRPSLTTTRAGYGTIAGAPSRGVEDSTLREYEISFRLHVLPLPIARICYGTSPSRRARLVRASLRSVARRRPRSSGRGSRCASCSPARSKGTRSPPTPPHDVRYVPTEAARTKHAKPEPQQLTAADITAILQAMPVEWRAFFFPLAQTGVRVGELLGLTWEHVHLGDDAHIVVIEQVYRGRAQTTQDGREPGEGAIVAVIASWLVELRPGTLARAPVFPSAHGHTAELLRTSTTACCAPR